MKKLFSILAFWLFGANLAFAGSLPYSDVTCGDHWIKISAVLDADFMTAVVTRSGDGLGDVDVASGLVSQGFNSLTIAILAHPDSPAGSGGVLILNTEEDGSVWGTYQVDLYTTGFPLGLCRVY